MNLCDKSYLASSPKEAIRPPSIAFQTLYGNKKVPAWKRSMNVTHCCRRCCCCWWCCWCDKTHIYNSVMLRSLYIQKMVLRQFDKVGWPLPEHSENWEPLSLIPMQELNTCWSCWVTQNLHQPFVNSTLTTSVKIIYHTEKNQQTIASELISNQRPPKMTSEQRPPLYNR